MLLAFTKGVFWDSLVHKAGLNKVMWAEAFVK